MLGLLYIKSGKQRQGVKSWLPEPATLGSGIGGYRQYTFKINN